MGCGSFAYLLLFPVIFKFSFSQKPNTDAFYVSEFFQKMGLEFSSFSNDPSSSVCSWRGVFCDTKEEKVTSLVASNLGLSGPIPENTIGKLGNLQSLDISINGITALPSDFWGIGSSLKNLNLSSNRVNGSLSNNIGNFGSLKRLDLSNNALSGRIPASIASLSILEIIDLHGNSFEGDFPSGFLSCVSLTFIDLSSNNFSGTIPKGAFNNSFRTLQVLNIADNGFTGGIPDLRGMPSLKYLDLSGNNLQGNLSEVWSEAPKLKHLNVAFNRFSVQKLYLPLVENLSSIEYLNLSSTNLAGEIPSDISKLGGLKTLDISCNYLVGRIPDLRVKNLQVLDVSLNNLTGEIPLQLQQILPDMAFFNFSHNNLTFCGAKLLAQLLKTAFIGSHNNCPIAVNPNFVGHRSMHNGIKVELAVVLSVFFLLLGMLCFAFWFKRKKTRTCLAKQSSSNKENQNLSGPFSFQTDSTTWVADVKLANSVPVMIFEKPLLNITFADLLTATSHFDRGTLLAEGKFGPVYRCFLPGGIHVAVKVLVHISSTSDEEAARELEHLGRIKHPNLVPLTGYCLAGEQRIAIYDYMENGNLQNLLHDLPLGIQPPEDDCFTAESWEDDGENSRSFTHDGLATWRFRHKIALGTSRALAFLHHGCIPQIVHRDMKASSIFLDSDFEPRLSDFGLAKIVGSNLEEMANPGYTPPELSDSENFPATSKSDVYGFGVVLFELITGKKTAGDTYPEEKEETTLVGWARSMVRRNRGYRIVDPKIRGTGSAKQMEAAVKIAYLCTAETQAKRPTMQQVVGLLKDIDPDASDQ